MRCLLFVDDKAITVKSETDLLRTKYLLCQIIRDYNLKISNGKMKAMAFRATNVRLLIIIIVYRIKQFVLQSDMLKNNGRERKLIKLHRINGEIKES